jgi:diguanylate cyclase (GGDEF)-like protein
MALDCYLQGLDYAAKYNVHGITHYFYNNIGSRYQELESYEKALDYFLLAEEDLETSLTLGEDNAINFLVTYLNLGDCYRYFKAFDRAEKYVDRTEKIMETYKVTPYAFPITLFKATLYMDQGKDEVVKGMIGELIEEAKKGKENLIDYSRFVKLLAGILTKLRDMDSLRQMIKDYAEVAEESDSVQMRLQLQEHCMDYYEAVGDWENYQKACVQHAVLYRERRIQENQETVQAINVKIQLHRAEKDMQEIARKAETDALTGLRNRFALIRETKNMMSDCIRQQKSLGMAIIDVDCFKQYNDTYGHKEGDLVLRKVAGALQQAIAKNGEVFRYGGDEFVILMPNVEEETCKELAQKIKERFATLRIENAKSTVEEYITVTQGYAVGVPKRMSVPDDYFTLADAGLYGCKNRGKNDFAIKRLYQNE